MSKRQRLTLEKLMAVLETEFTKSLGRTVAEYMPHIRMRARAGEPNWHAEIAGDTSLSILGAFFESFDRVRSVYDLDGEDRDRLISQGRR